MYYRQVNIFILGCNSTVLCTQNFVHISKNQHNLLSLTTLSHQNLNILELSLTDEYFIAHYSTMFCCFVTSLQFELGIVLKLVRHF